MELLTGSSNCVLAAWYDAAWEAGKLEALVHPQPFLV
jgi:hypothetical protein